MVLVRWENPPEFSRVLGFEVKAGERVSGKDFRGLHKLRYGLGEKLVACVALSLESGSYTFEDGLHVMPVDRFWRVARH